MAPKGKAIDKSTHWSAYQWDDRRKQWRSSRLNEQGHAEYDYRYPDTSQSTPPDQVAIPRFPGPNTFKDSTSSGTGNEAYGSEESFLYTTSIAPVTRYQTGRGYDDVPNYYAEESFQARSELTSSDTESVGTIRNPPSTSYATSSSYYTTSTTYQPGASTEHVVNSFASMNINSSSEDSEQVASTTLPREGKLIRNPSRNSGSSEKLDPRYKVVEERKQKKFWKVGRVFMMLWTEPARSGNQDARGGPSTTGSANSRFSRTYLEETAFSEIRRFVVLSEGYGNTICSPVHTYGGQATLKPNLPERMQHAIIYTSAKAPQECCFRAADGTLVFEELIKDPIKVHREQSGPEGELSSLSRINYSKIYTVENYVRVLNVGMVEDEFIPTLIHNSFMKPRESPIERPRNPSGRTSSYAGDRKSRGKGKEREGGKTRR